MKTTDPSGVAKSHVRANPQGGRQRLLAVQVLRAVGALLVAWVHAINAAEDALLGTPKQAHFFHWEDFGASGLDIFFVISGFIVSLVAARAASEDRELRGANARQFLSRRITRIFPLFWILTALSFVRVLLAHPEHTTKISWLPTLLLFPSISYPPGIPLLYLGWSLVFEMYFYFALAAFLYLTPRSVIRNTVLLLSGMVALGLAIDIRRPLLIFWMNPMVLEFVLGCVIGLLFARVSKSEGSFSKLGIVLAWVGALSLAATVFTGYGMASEARSLPGRIAGCVLVFGACLPRCLWVESFSGVRLCDRFPRGSWFFSATRRTPSISVLSRHWER